MTQFDTVPSTAKDTFMNIGCRKLFLSGRLCVQKEEDKKRNNSGGGKRLRNLYHRVQ
jgi:hypothetical protein